MVEGWECVWERERLGSLGTVESLFRSLMGRFSLLMLWLVVDRESGSGCLVEEPDKIMSLQRQKRGRLERILTGGFLERA